MATTTNNMNVRNSDDSVNTIGYSSSNGSTQTKSNGNNQEESEEKTKSKQNSKPRSSQLHGLIKTIIGECLMSCDAFPTPTTLSLSSRSRRRTTNDGDDVDDNDASSDGSFSRFVGGGSFRTNDLLREDLRIQGDKLGRRLFGCATSGFDQSSSSSLSNALIMSLPKQFVQLQGLGVISLGALEDELTPRQRIWDTFNQSTSSSSRTDRLISIGYLVQEQIEESAEPLNREDSDDIIDDESTSQDIRQQYPKTLKVTTQSIPFDVWLEAYPNEKQQMPNDIRNLINKVEGCKFDEALNDLRRKCAQQTRRASIYSNADAYLRGITLHNMGVITVLSLGSKADIHEDHVANVDKDDSHGYATALSLFEQAVSVKKEAFGSDHIEVALSLDEIGITQFSMERYEEALAAFAQSLLIWKKIENHQTYQKQHRLHRRDSNGESTGTLSSGANASQLHQAMILSNIGCCYFQMRDREAALSSLLLARTLLQHGHVEPTQIDGQENGDFGQIRVDLEEKKIGEDYESVPLDTTIASNVGTAALTPTEPRVGGTEARADLDLLHRAILVNNLGFLYFHEKQYETARECFEEALLIQQSVLGDAHNDRAIRDSRANLEFTNVFHSM